MTDNVIQVSIGAKIDSLITEFSRARGSVDNSVKSIAVAVKEAMTSVEASTVKAGESMQVLSSKTKTAAAKTEMSLEGLKKAFMGLAVVTAAFEGFHFMAEWAAKAKDIQNASQQLGISTTQVQRLDAAAKLAGVSTEGLHKSAGILAKNMQAAAEGNKQMQTELAKVGVTTKDYKNLNFDEVLGKIADKTAAAKDGIEKMAVAKKLLGRAGTELIPLLNQGSKGIKDMGDEAEKTGGVMGVDMVRHGAALEDSLKKAGMIVTGFMNLMADAFAPVLTMITDLLGEQGGAANALGDVFKTLATVIEVVIGTVRASWIILKTVITEIITAIMTTIDTINRFLHLDFKGGVEAHRRGAEQMKQIWRDATNEIKKSTESTAKAIAQTWGDLDSTTKSAKKAPTSGLDDDAGGGGKGKKEKGMDTRLQQWQEELDTKKLMTDAFHEMSTASELAFWEGKLKLTKQGSTEELSVTKTVLGLRKKMAVETLADTLDKIKEQIDAEEAGSQKRVDLANQELIEIGKTYGEGSKQYIAMEKVKEQYAKDHLKLVIKDQEDIIKHTEKSAFKLIQIEEDKYKFLEQMGQINKQQMYQLDDQLEAHKYTAAKQALEDQLKIDGLTFEEKALLNDKLEELEDEHRLRVQRLNEGALLDMKSQWESYFNTITQGFANTFQGILAGQTTFKQGMIAIGQQLLSQFLSQEASKLASTLAGNTAMAASGVAKNVVVGSSDKMAAAQSTVLTAGSAIKNILAHAAEAFTGIYKSIAAIPYVGPFLAPAMAAAGFAVVAGMVSKVASAEGGWGEVPYDGMQTILHKKEMVLPAPLAEGVRDIVDKGGTQGGGQMTLNINAMDPRSFLRFATDNHDAFGSMMQQYMNNHPELQA